MPDGHPPVELVLSGQFIREHWSAAYAIRDDLTPYPTRGVRVPTVIVEVDCPYCHRLLRVQVYPATAERAAAGDPSEVYEQCPKCGQTFPLVIPAPPDPND